MHGQAVNPSRRDPRPATRGRTRDVGALRHGLAIAASAISVGVHAPAAAQATAYPVKPIRMFVALASGGGVDTTGRIIAQRLNELWGQPVVVENRPGAGGTVAAETVARAAPDGHTILMASSSMAITPSLMKLPFNAARDLLPVTLAVISPGVMVVHPSVPVKSVKELVAFARSRQGELLYSTSGPGTGQHLAIELFNQMTGVRMTHVPYKGTAPSITDLVGGRVALSVASVISTRQLFESGKLRALAVLGAKRTPALPDYPTVAEAGVPGYGVENWYSLFLPAATPMDVALRLRDAAARIVREPAMEKKLLGMGLDAVGSTQAEFARFYSAELVKWEKVVRTVGIEAK